MSFCAYDNQKKSKSSNIGENLATVLLRKAPATEITWIILGGKQCVLNEPVSGLDFLLASGKGVTKLSIESLANVMDVQ